MGRADCRTIRTSDIPAHTRGFGSDYPGETSALNCAALTAHAAATCDAPSTDGHAATHADAPSTDCSASNLATTTGPELTARAVTASAGVGSPTEGWPWSLGHAKD